MTPQEIKRGQRIIESIPGHEQIEEAFRNPWFWRIAVIAAASGLVGYTTWRALRRRYKGLEISEGVNEEVGALVQGLDAELQDGPPRKHPLKTTHSLTAALVSNAVEAFGKGEDLDLRGFYTAFGHPIRQVRIVVGQIKEALARNPDFRFAGVNSRELYHFLSGVDVTAEGADNEHRERELRERLIPRGYVVVRAPETNHTDWEDFGRLMKESWRFSPFRNARHGVIGAELTGPESLLFPQGVLLVKRPTSEGYQNVGYVTFIAIDGNLSPNDLDNLTFQDALERRVDYFEGATIMVTSATKHKKTSIDVVGVGLLALVEFAREEGAKGVWAPAFSPYAAMKQREKGGSYEDYWGKTDEEGRPEDLWRQLLLSLAEKEGPFNSNFMEFRVSPEELSRTLSEKERLELVSHGIIHPKGSPVPVIRDNGGFKCVIPAGWIIFDGGNPRRWRPTDRLKLLHSNLA